jgi:hypothetical protein
MLRRSQLNNALVAAIMFDLVLMGKLELIGGRLATVPGEIQDPVLNQILLTLSKYSGKKLSWLIAKMPEDLKMCYSLQVKHLANTHMITRTPLKWMGITWDNRFRVCRHDSIRPLITAFDRVLIYGRNPELHLRLLIELIGMLHLHRFFYSDKGQKSRVSAMMKSIVKRSFELHDESFREIIKRTRNGAGQKH